MPATLQVRALRAALPLQELVGAAETGAALLGGHQGQGGAGGDDDDNDGASLWSSASSVVSGAGGGSVSSASSGRSTASSRAGLFSHLSATSTGQRLVESRSLRLAGGGLSRREAASLDHEGALRTVHRREAAAQRREAQGGRGKPGKTKRHRPGSSAEEASIETEVSSLLPLPGSAIAVEAAALSAQLLEFGSADAADSVVRAFNGWVAEIEALPSPAPKRNAAVELAGLRGALQSAEGGAPANAASVEQVQDAGSVVVEGMRANIVRLLLSA